MDSIVGFLTEVWNLHVSMSIWLILGFACSALLGILIPASIVNRHLSGRGWGPVWKASLLGVPLPLCSCSVIPTGLGLLKKGASKAATMSFITSTPQTGVESFILTGGALGWPFALLKAIAAFVMGIVVGGLLPKEKVELASTEREEKDRDWKSMLHFGFIELPLTLFKPYLMGLILSGILMQWFSPGSLSELIGHGWLESIAILLFSVPLYLCATASIPLGMALLHQGLSLGGVAIFLIAGPVTNLISLMMIHKTMGKKVTAIYLGVIILGSMLLSFVLNQFYHEPMNLNKGFHHHEEDSWLNLIAAMILLVLFMSRYLPSQKKEAVCHSNITGETTLSLSGLTCGGCVSKLRSALDEAQLSYSGLTTDQLTLESGFVDKACDIVESCGFRVEKPKGQSCCH